MQGLDLFLSPFFLAVVGLMIGSFLNVVIHRKPIQLERQWLQDTAGFLSESSPQREALGLPADLAPQLAACGQKLDQAIEATPAIGLAKPRSRCPHCGHQIAWYENIPVVSWLVLRGKCSACKAPISARYPAIELLTGGLFFAVATMGGASAATVVWCIAVALLIAMAFIDYDTTLLPDDLTFALIGLSLLAAWMKWTPVSLEASALGVLFGYLSLWSIATLYRLIRGVEGMAEGDFKLLAGLGGLVGWKLLPSIILLSSVVGAVVGIFLIVGRGRDSGKPIPFGPYLAGGGVAALFWGQQLTEMWWPSL